MTILNGSLKLDRADNGFILAWYEGTVSRREVYEDAGDLFERISQLLDIPDTEIERTYHNPAVDPDIADMMPDNAPPSVFAGD